MSARLPAVRPRQLIRILERKGWKLVRTRGSHLVFAHADNPKLITIPNHPGDLKRPLLAIISLCTRVSAAVVRAQRDCVQKSVLSRIQ